MVRQRNPGHVVALLFFCGEGMNVGRGFVNVQVVDPGPVGVRWVCLRGPVNILPSGRGLGAGDVEDSYILTTGPLFCMHVRQGDVQSGIEVLLGHGGDFP